MRAPSSQAPRASAADASAALVAHRVLRGVDVIGRADALRTCRNGRSEQCRSVEGPIAPHDSHFQYRYCVRLAKACTPHGWKYPSGKLSLQPEALGAAHEVTT